ncbi:unnamed protein product [Coregonus sp. 'balchen']|nr:unnamed protein product [Coregonus sp. 'balchen']
MAQFQEVMRQQLETSMHTELEKLLDTATGGDKEHLNKKYNTDVPLVLMNSFNTDEDTKKILQKYTHHREYIFVSNIDNLGATVDLNILHHLVSQPNGKRCEFIMEVTDKTRADVKVGGRRGKDGGHFVVPKAHVDEFKSVTKFKIFNTNNLWISLGAIKRLQEQNALDMEIIVNPKVQEYQTRFESIPDMLELDHLTVSGDVTFGKQVSLKGTVIIIANHGDRIDIPAGTILENKIVSGNLRILDH